MLTMEPVAFCEKLAEVLPLCEHVGECVFLDEQGEEVTMGDIREMEFVPLEESAQGANDVPAGPPPRVQRTAEATSMGARTTLEELQSRLKTMHAVLDSTAAAVNLVADKLGVVLHRDSNAIAVNESPSNGENNASSPASGSASNFQTGSRSEKRPIPPTSPVQLM
ncbi:hypothetical protein AB1Y20_008403 [Prymnesium parvum]|uniref:Uncharacterized protein n=1 Tax=Prymnesium parvum TaxID=97485 RepID=A0AB34IR49_PRYPA